MSIRSKTCGFKNYSLSDQYFARSRPALAWFYQTKVWTPFSESLYRSRPALAWFCQTKVWTPFSESLYRKWYRNWNDPARVYTGKQRLPSLLFFVTECLLHQDALKKHLYNTHEYEKK